MLHIDDVEREVWQCMHVSWWGNPNNNNLEQKFSASSSNFPSSESRYLIGCKVAATFDKGKFLRPLYGPIFQGSRLLWVTQSYSHVDGQTKWTVKMRSVELYWLLSLLRKPSNRWLWNRLEMGPSWVHKVGSITIELSPNVFGSRPSYSNTKRVDGGI